MITLYATELITGLIAISGLVFLTMKINRVFAPKRHELVREHNPGW